MSFKEAVSAVRDGRFRKHCAAEAARLADAATRGVRAGGGQLKEKSKPLWSGAQASIAKQLDTVAEITGASSPSQVLSASVKALRDHVTLVVAFSACINLLYLAPSLYMMQVYDRVLPTGGLLTLLLLSVVLLVAFAVMGFLDALRGRLLARASLRVERMAAEPVMRQVFDLRRQAGQPGAFPGIRDLETLRGGLSSPAMIGLLDIPWTPLFIIICFVIHFWIGLLALGGAFLIFSLALINERASRRSIASVSKMAGGFYAGHEADLSMAESAKALGLEDAMIRRRIEMRSALVEAQTQSAFSNAEYSALTKAVRQILQSAALGLGCLLAVQQQVSPGAIIAATILTARAFAPVEQVVGGWRQLGAAWAAFKDLRKMLEGAAAAPERTPLPAPQARVQVEHVSAAAPGAQVLAVQGVSFAAQPGELIGIIGPSGAGKTTLARVLANAAAPVSGTVRVDAAKYADWDAGALARHIGYLPQRVDLTDGTVAENISRFARFNGDPMDVVGPKVIEAARLAAAHEMILGLPQGYETRLGLSGAGVSPGQAQRIALARALYDNPQVVVLDEPNAHLDSEGEVALLQALGLIRARGAVAFIVAHRAGVLSIVDKIAVMKEGRLIEFGSRNDVMARLNPPKQQPPQQQAARPMPARAPQPGAPS